MIAIAAGLINGRVRGPNKIRVPLTSTEDIKLSLRLDQAQLNVVIAEYHQWRMQQLGNHRLQYKRSAAAMTLFLHYLARGGYFHQIGRAEGIAKTTAHDYLHDIGPFFENIAHLYIRMPGPQELDNISLPLQHPDNPLIINHYKVVMYIDGFIVKIQRPDHAGDAYFCDRHGKSCDSINVQYINDKNGHIRHVITGLSGSTHDKTAAAWSREFMTYLDNLPAGYVVLGMLNLIFNLCFASIEY